MQLSKFSDYALRILIHLAASPDQLLSTRQIAELHDAKYNHLAKITGWLVNEGYAISSRGRGGGLKLAKQPDEINLGKVFRALEADKPLVECMSPDGGNCRFSTACGLSVILDTAQEAFFQSLEQFTLSDLPRMSPGMTKLLDMVNSEIA
ncbi:RrF2 family transcriptional regulator [Parasedimentitalea huanghaiensis]|uniref:Rrf2 family transcriptional regulator n=1 Tax=Parasedimentitalea huanghaiensis TaxID=2682100 RepID=A0A6L6WFW7_9RHOB|nr:Rrf2 family transcriptional regulator [Zongyanglinia huanghaiensis]MVO16191.1 Rrf2 family transcriptional regulator [Zongyanglinia huanghaiensis]